MSLLGGLLSRSEERTTNFSDWDQPWTGGSHAVNRSGVTVDEDTQFNLSAVWACETLITDSVAMLPVDTYRKTADRRVPTTKPGWMVRPNPRQNPIDFETQRLMSLLVWGNAYTLLIRAQTGGPIRERWVLDPWRVQVRAVNGRVSYWFDGRELLPEAVQHIPGYTKPGNVKGMSVVANAAQTFGLYSAAERFDASFLSNGAAPSGVLEMPQMPAEVKEETVERLRNQFMRNYSGPDAARKPIVLAGGTTWNQTMVNPNDAQLLETRRFQLAEIARWFRVPPFMIGDVERSTSWGTGIEQQGLGFLRFTLMPWLVRLEQADSKLLPNGQFCKYNVDAIVRADLKTRYETHKIAIDAGMATPNDRRQLEDEPPLPGGDAVRIQLAQALINEGQQLDPGTASTIGQLVRSGFLPEAVLAALGLPPIDHLGYIPVTLTEPHQQGTPGSPNGPQ